MLKNNNKDECVSTSFDSKEEELAHGGTIKTVTLLSHDGESRTFDVGDGFVMVSDSVKGEMISLAQGSREYLMHSVTMMLTLIGASVLNDISVERLYDDMHPVTKRAIDNVLTVVRTHKHLQYVNKMNGGGDDERN